MNATDVSWGAIAILFVILMVAAGVGLWLTEEAGGWAGVIGSVLLFLVGVVVMMWMSLF